LSTDHIKRYAFKVPVMFEGDRGSGKTFDVREFARSEKMNYLEVAGHESVEAIDFLGHPMQSEHGIVWKDGKMSQAFRAARDGKKTVLLIDEMLRIPQRHLSVLLSALSPDSEGNFRLQTGRMVGVHDGVGVEEEIVVPSSNLAIFATTNVGPEFAIDELDPAVAERFIIARKDTEKPVLTKILQGKAKSKGFSSIIALKLVEMFEKTRRMVDTGTLNRHATTRTLARALEYADSEADVKMILKDQVLLWADRDSAGKPVAAQVTQLTRTIDELFPDAPKAAPVARKSKDEPESEVALAPSAGSTSGAMTLLALLAAAGGVAEEPAVAYLEMRDGSADKLYNVHLEADPSSRGQWRVRAEGGRRGASTLRQYTKAEAISYASAKKAYVGVVAEKTGKGYSVIKPRKALKI
jgi:hypothetical protein